jgi:hypothetical protein
VAVVTWVPLPLLSAVSIGRGGAGAQLHAVLTDFGTLARYLIALPLLVVADLVVGARLTAIARHFVASGLVPPESQERFEALLATTRNWCASGWAAIFIVAFSSLLIATIHEAMPAVHVPAWRVDEKGGTMSPAGWWHLLVSVPILFFVAGSWLWRLLVWTRFLWHAAYLPLRLTAAHPDHAAGLRFVAFSVRDFALLGTVVGVFSQARSPTASSTLVPASRPSTTPRSPGCSLCLSSSVCRSWHSPVGCCTSGRSACRATERCRRGWAVFSSASG